MKKFAVIRDDDLNYHSSIAQIKHGYRDILGKVPVNFFIIPEIHDPNLTYSSYELDYHWKELSVGRETKFLDNSELADAIRELTKAQKVDVGIHGLHHHKQEFLYDISEEKLKSLISELSDFFGREISSVSAPNNSLGRRSEEILEKYFNVFYVSYCHQIWERRLSPSNVLAFARFALFKLAKKQASAISGTPRKINGHYEISSLPISSSQTRFFAKSTVDSFLSNNASMLCLASHYYDLADNAVTHSLMVEVIELLRNSGVIFLRLREVEGTIPKCADF